MKITEEIIAPFKIRLETTNYKTPDVDEWGMTTDIYLFMKWAYRVEKGWYGFALNNAPMIWALIIQNFLEELEKEAPDFKIHQIKLKFGRLCFYVDLNIEDKDKIEQIKKEIGKLESLLYSADLVY